MLRFKDRKTADLTSEVVYRYRFGGCNVTYYGQTNKTGVTKHTGISTLTGESVRSKPSVIREHLEQCNYNAIIKDFDILASGNNTYQLEMNKMVQSAPLYLLDAL